jgi:hypothetical protein
MQYKDIADMITKGKMQPKKVIDIINENTYNGLMAEFQLKTWSKVKEFI